MGISGDEEISISDPTTGTKANIVTVHNVNRVAVDCLGEDQSTYSATVTALATAASATDIVTIVGSSTKTVIINAISISGKRATGAQTLFHLIRRSTDNSGGTSSTATLVKHDTNSASATAVVRSYTANPTLGTTVGAIRATTININDGTSFPSPVLVWQFGTHGSRPVLRGTSEILSINLGGSTLVNPLLDFWIEWVEV